MIKAEVTPTTMIVAITVSIALLIAILIFLVPRIFSTSQTFKDTDQDTSVMNINQCKLLCGVVEKSNLKCTSSTEFCRKECYEVVSCSACSESDCVIASTP